MLIDIRSPLSKITLDGDTINLEDIATLVLDENGMITKIELEDGTTLNYIVLTRKLPE